MKVVVAARAAPRPLLRSLHRARSVVATAARSAPVRRLRQALAATAPAPVKVAYDRLRVRPRPRWVPLDRLLLGDQGGVDAAAYSRLTGDLMRPSTPIHRWPRVELLRMAASSPVPLARSRLRSTAYVRQALRCVEVTGHYFGLRSEEEILDATEAFLRWDGGALHRRAGGSPPGRRPRVRAVRHSDCYQVVDGHHRLARALINGDERALVDVEWRRVLTPLQQLLLDMSWLQGRRELYQPVTAPELGQAWTLVRRCDDRLARMRSFLEGRHLLPPATSTYLDVASCYGWFVERMGRAGFDARGIERDPRGPTVGQHAYGLDPDRIAVGDCIPLLDALEDRVDVVSCFSLLHHFVLGRGTAPPERLIELLDRVTARVLFLDTGQAHEAWFADQLPEWDADHVRRWLERHTTFDAVVPLGPDDDRRPPFEANYGRMLFACVRAA